ncbi:MAG: hypothetical protein AAF604_19400, partial [Acidobacteriota bacterium]
MSRLVFAAILILLLALVAPALAQPKPVEARGFSPGEVYDYSGLDSVNLFNGNLVLAPAYPSSAATADQPRHSSPRSTAILAD